MSTKEAKIANKETLCASIASLYLSETYSDVTFVVDEAIFPAHRVILASRNEGFGLLLKMNESKMLKIENTTPVAFGLILRYIYSGEIDLSAVDMKEELNIFKMVKQLKLDELEGSLCDHIRRGLTPSNVLFVLQVAISQRVEPLEEACLKYVQKKMPQVLQHKSFANISWELVAQILRLKPIEPVPEIEKFKAVVNWSQNNPKPSAVDIMSVVKFKSMSQVERTTFVRPSKLLNDTEIMDALELPDESEESSDNEESEEDAEDDCDAMSSVTANSEPFGAQLQSNSMKVETQYFVDESVDLTSDITVTPINKSVIIKLSFPQNINQIKMNIISDLPSISYVVEITSDGTIWQLVIDYSSYKCYSWQSLFFKGRTVKAIRVTRVIGGGKKNMKPMFIKSFKCGSFERYPRTDGKGVIVSNRNVALPHFGARVYEGTTEETEILMGKSWEQKREAKDYRTVSRGINRPLIVQFPQPYLVSNFSFMLANRPNCVYNYYASISADGINWKEVADNKNTDCNGLQTVTFASQPVSFVRITGTKGFEGKLHLLHFECPRFQPKRQVPKKPAAAAASAQGSGQQPKRASKPRRGPKKQPSKLVMRNVPSQAGWTEILCTALTEVMAKK